MDAWSSSQLLICHCDEARSAKEESAFLDSAHALSAKNRFLRASLLGMTNWTIEHFHHVQSLLSRMTDSPGRKLIIAIDGPAGAGKSTIASRLARKLGYVNLESGAMYRALAFKAIDNDISLDDEAALVKLAEASRIQLEPTIGGNRTLLDGHDISSRIRERDVTEAASRVSIHPKVREWMVAHQRAMGAGGGGEIGRAHV